MLSQNPQNALNAVAELLALLESIEIAHNMGDQARVDVLLESRREKMKEWGLPETPEWDFSEMLSEFDPTAQ